MFFAIETGPPAAPRKGTTAVDNFLRDVMKDVLDATRRVRDQLPVNAPHRRGRPSGRGRPRKSPRWRQKLLTDAMHLLVKNPTKLTRSEKKTLRRLYDLDRRLRTLRRLSESRVIEGAPVTLFDGR